MLLKQCRNLSLPNRCPLRPRYAAAAAAMYAAGPPTLPAAVALPLRVAALALCYLATHPQRAVLRTVAELDCLALQCVLCYRGTRLRIGHLAEAKVRPWLLAAFFSSPGSLPPVNGF